MIRPFEVDNIDRSRVYTYRSGKINLIVISIFIFITTLVKIKTLNVILN